MLIRKYIHNPKAQMPGLDASWVGDCPWTKNLCLAGEDGRLFFLPERGAEEGSNPTWIQPATDTINAVAFAGEFIAVSSRNEVLVGKRVSGHDPRIDFFPHSFIGGAHGIEASHAGAFLAPIGDLGLLILTHDDRQASTRSPGTGMRVSTSTGSFGSETGPTAKCSLARRAAMDSRPSTSPAGHSPQP